MSRTAYLVIAALLVNSVPASAWWDIGHQVVARIAVAHLSPAARTRVARILGVDDSGSAVADALAQASTWADETKAQTKTGEWHFIDLALQDTKSNIAERCPDENCAPARIKIFAGELRSTISKPDGSELDALRYVVHFVGDIHQPLHTISDADLGGNCERLASPVDTASNVHALWDGAIIAEMDTDQLKLTASLESDVRKLSKSHRNRLVQGTADDWVWESHELAVTDVYGKLHIPLEPVIFPKSCIEAPIAITGFKPHVDGLYIDAMKPVVREQLIKGGLRLAHLLNESL